MLLRIDTDRMEDVSARLRSAASQLDDLQIPHAPFHLPGLSAELSACQAQCHKVADKGRSLAQAVSKTAQMFQECEERLARNGQNAGSTEEAERIGTYLFGERMPPDNIVVDGEPLLPVSSAGEAIGRGLKGVSRRFFLPHAIHDAHDYIANVIGSLARMVRGGGKQGGGAFLPETCDQQRDLAFGIYDGFPNGPMIDQLNAQGYNTVAIRNPAGVAAVRIGADGVPEIQIVMQGSKSAGDWATNLSASTNEEGFHVGFANNADSFLGTLADQPLGNGYGDATYGDLLNGAANGMEARISITGHSLGGAEAQIIAARMLQNGIPTGNVTAYGRVLIGDGACTELSDAKTGRLYADRLRQSDGAAAQGVRVDPHRPGETPRRV